MSVSKIVAAAASTGGGSNLALEEVFSTHLWTGTGSAFSVNNGIDLSGEGGLVWIKNRGPNSANHALYDTARGVRKFLYSNATNAQDTASSGSGLTAFNSNGFNIGTGWVDENNNGQDVVSWTWRKAPKFFDIVTWSDGDGTTNHSKQISHNLGSTPGMIIVKKTTNTDRWQVAHRGMSTGDVLYLSEDNEKNDLDANTVRIVNDSYFTVAYNQTNEESNSYVAYLFAHHANDGSNTGFGSNGDSPVIACGSKTFSGNGEFTIDLGFEAQWVLWKRADSSSDWNIMDMMRPRFDVPASTGGGQTLVLRPNSSGMENTNGLYMGPSSSVAGSTARGFAGYNVAGASTWIYMAIAHPVSTSEEPTDATKVFAVQDGRGASKLFTAGFPIDMFLQGDDTGDDWQLKDRLRQIYNLATNSAAAQTSDTFYYFDDQTGLVTSSGGGSAISQLTGYMWKRAKGFCDVLTYTGTGSATTIAHQLGAVPEMIWVKCRSHTVNWAVYHKDLSAGQYVMLNKTNAVDTNSAYFTTTAPTSSVFSIGVGEYTNQSSTRKYVAYLFATVAGVSKVGSYDGNGSNQNIDCGFSNGAKFILIKSKQSGSWYVFDTARGIVAGNDSHLKLEATDAEAYADSIDTYSGGFNVVQNSTTDLNKGPSDESYIFYAIA